MNKYQKKFLINWKTSLITLLSVMVMLGFLLFQLGTLTGQLSSKEVSVYKTNVSYKSTVNNPINAPYYLVRNTLQKVTKPKSIIIPRLTSVIFAILVLFSFGAVLSFWYKSRLLILGTLLFASSSWFLHLARIGLPVSMQSLGIILILFSAWLHQTKKLKLAMLFVVFSVGFLIYIPGMIWLILAAALWKGRALKKDIKQLHNVFLYSYGLLLLIILSPLLWSIFKNPNLGLQLTGLSNILDGRQMLVNFYNIPMQIFVRANPNPIINIGILPLLDIFTTVMFVIGVYVTGQKIKLDRNKLTFGLLFIGIVYSTLQTSPFLPMMIVPVYLFAVSGMSYMLDEWFSVFPKNPLAKAIATTLISVLALAVAYYHINSYFIAWPNNPKTKSSFSERI